MASDPLDAESLTDGLSGSPEAASELDPFEQLGDDADFVLRYTSSEDEHIDAGGGDDIVLTGSGNDHVLGGDGNDYIQTGAGNDTINAGAGQNVMAGGTGNDTFVVDAADLVSDAAYEMNTILDFDPTQDILRLVGFDFASLADIPVVTFATGIGLQLATGRVLFLQGVKSVEALEGAVDLGGPTEEPPVVTVALVEDSGDPDDGLTNTLAISGRIESETAVVALFLSINGAEAVDVSAALDGTGGFLIDQDAIRTTNGGALPDGDYTLAVTARTGSGLTSAPQQVAATLDTTAPAADIGLSLDTDTGKQGDLATERELVDLVVTTEAGATVALGSTTVTADADGRAVLTDVALVLGENTFDVAVTDAAGNAAVERVVVTREAPPPDAPTVTLSLVEDTGTPDDGITNAISLTGTISTTDPGALLFLSLDGAEALDVSAALDGTGGFLISGGLIGPLTEGPHIFDVTARIGAGPVSAPASVGATLDTTAPAAIIELSPDTDTGTQGDLATERELVDLVVTTEAGATVALGGTTVAANADGRAVLTGVALELGENTFDVTVTDAAGNAAVERVVVTREATPNVPTVTLSLVEDTGTPDDGITSAISLAGTISTTDPGALLFLSLDGAEAVDVSAALDGTGGFLISGALIGPLAEGPHTFDVTARIGAGPVSAPASVGATLDTTAPTLSGLALTPETDTDPDGDGITGNRSIAIIGTTEPNAVVSAGGQSTTADATGAFTLSGISINEGPNEITVEAVDGAGNSASEIFNVTGEFDDEGEPPTVSAALIDDTGTDGDLLSSDVGLAGTVAGDAAITKLTLSINGAPAVDVTAALNADGSFTLAMAALADANGGGLADGPLSFALVATDAAGRVSAPATVDATLDTEAPGLENFGLAPSSDTGVLGDGITSLRSVKIVGEGEPGATVSAGDARTIVGVDGTFSLIGVPIAEGANTITLTTTDAAGNSASEMLQITGIAAVGGSPVLLWNGIALAGIADNASAGTEASRVLAMQSVAVHDVVAALDRSPAFLVSDAGGAAADLAAAVAMASYTVLTYAFPSFAEDLDLYLAEALGDVPDGARKDAGTALGKRVADAVIAIRDSDGWNDFEMYPGSDVPGEWRETGPLFETALDPQWATMQPWSLDDPSQFRPGAPPALASQAYAEAVAEVQAIGASDSTVRTADQAEAARFWKDGRGTETTPGQWNSIATDFMELGAVGPGEAARTLAVLNVSIADAMIAAWDAKYEYGLWRPEDAIRHADTDGNPATTADPDWQPFMLAPAHPEYVSGHSAASGAAAEVLTELFGTQTFTTDSLGMESITRTFDSYWDAAQENADSRLWAGVHYRFSNETGLELGRDTASFALQAFANAADVTPPTIVIDAAVTYASMQPVEITGAVLDTLSGVKSLTVEVNGGTASALGFAADGAFTYALDGVTDGMYQINFRAKDAAGNESNAQTAKVIVDSADPSLTLTGLNGEGQLVGSSARLKGSIDGTGSPIVALAYHVNSGPTTALAYNPATGAFNAGLNLAALEQGEHTVRVIAADAAGNSISQDVPLVLAAPVPFTISRISPANGAQNVGSTFRPEAQFSRPVDASTLTTDSFYATGPTGKKLAANVVLSPDGMKAWLFLDAPMPGANKIKLTLDGSIIRSKSGVLLDGDRDGEAGGSFSASFKTVSTAATPGTTLSGFVVDPGPDLKPMTVDDFSAGPDGVDYTDDDMFLSPIQGATVFILGLEHIKVTTDENGYFELTKVPAGNVKIAVDGRTATNAPDGVFWPEMVMDGNVIAGQANTVMASMGSTEEREAVEGRGEVYLPRVPNEILQDLSETEATEIGMPVSAAQDLTAAQRNAIKLVVQPGAAVDEKGQQVADAQVGISTVPPELVMDMLPAGIMQHTFDLTIQAPDAAVFTTPAQLTLPNVFNAPPGTKLNLLSFDHTTGRLVIEGTGTVSADGKTVTTDPGTGITKPGWHGMTPPGNCGGPGGPPDQPEPPDPTDTSEELDPEVVGLIFNDGSGFSWEREWMAPEELEDTPPPPPGDDECAPPPPAADPEGQEQPYIKVTIDVEGPLGDFLKKSGDLPLTGASFTLQAGSGDTKKFGLSAKTFAELVTGGMKKIEENLLYGSKVTITEEEGKPDGSTHTTIQDIYFTRYVDATDDDHGDQTSEFADALIADVKREPELKVKGAAGLTVEVDSTTHFQASNTKLTFDPAAKGDQTAKLKFKYDGGVEVAETITLKGEGKEKQKVFIDQAGLKSHLQAIGTGTNATVTYDATVMIGGNNVALKVSAAELALIDDKDAMGNATDETGPIAAGVVARSKADYSGYSDGIQFVNTSAAADVTIQYNVSADRDYGHADIVDIGTLQAVLNNKANYSKAELYFRMDEQINKTNAGTVNVHAETVLEFAAVGSSAALIKSLADTTSHEGGHTLGMVHTWKNVGGTIKDSGVTGAKTNIMMGHAGDIQSALTFNGATDGALKMLANMTYTKAEAKKAFDYYHGNLVTGGYFSTPGQPDGAAPEGFTDGNSGETAFPDPTLVLLEDEGSVVLGELGFGLTAVDGDTPPTRTITLLNVGAQPLQIDAFTLDGVGFQVSQDISGTVLQSFEQISVELTFDPSMAGAIRGQLFIGSNDPSGALTVELTGTGAVDGPDISVTSDNSNLGGVDQGDTVSDAEMFTITNDGLSDLVVSNIALEEAATNFALVGVPADLGLNPIVLATGESFTFGVEATGVEPGISRGAIHITSNDAASPEVTVAAMATSFDGLHYFDWGNDFVAVDVNGETLRTRTDDDGGFDLFLPNDAAYTVTVFDPESGLVAVNYGTTNISGRGTDLTSGLVFRPSTAPDRDFEGLPDDIEHAIGTSPTNADSDGDGISDFNAVASGIEALDSFSTNTGVVSTLPLDGAVRKVFAATGLPGSGTDPLIVLTSSGMAVLDVSQPRFPTLTAFADTLGTIETGAYDPALNRLVIVDSSGAVKLYGLADPANPTMISQLSANGNAVVIFEGLALVGVGGRLTVFDIATGEELDSVRLGSATSLRGLTNDGAFAYAFDDRGALHVVEVLGDGLNVRGSVGLSLSSGQRQLFAAEGVVYVPATNGFAGGYLTVDVSNPDAPTLLSGADDTSLGGSAIALGGAGRGLVVGDPGGVFGVKVIDVVTTRDPEDTGALITRYAIDDKPTAVAIARGVGYVGDEAGNLHVVNFQPFDAGGVAPVITIDPASLDHDPVRDGIQINEGTLVAINATITDDVGLRSVSLLANGTAIATDLSYPFDLFVRAPLLDPGEDSRELTLRVRATDTGGNVGLSQPIPVEITPDLTAPVLVSSTVEEGELLGRSVRRFTFNFDEPLDAQTMSAANFALTGPDGAVQPTLVQLRLGDRSITLVYDPLPSGAYSFTLNGTAITDVAGNAFSDADQVVNFDIGTFSNEWTGEAGTTEWSNPGNWSAGRVPDETDDVFFGGTGATEVNVGSFDQVTVTSLIAEGTIILPFGARLVIETEAVLDHVIVSGGELVLNGDAEIGTLEVRSGTVSGSADISVTELLDWTTGTMGPGGLLTVENGAFAEFGQDYDPEGGFTPSAFLNLQRDLTLEGNGIVGVGNVYLGQRVFDPDISAYVYQGGRFTIAPGAELELASYRADFYLNFITDEAEFGIDNQGRILKTGGGTSTIVPLGGTLGELVTEDGFIAIGSGSTLILTEDTDLSGLTALRIEGGELRIDGDISLDTLSIVSGTITGAGTLTVTNLMDWTGGSVSGDGGLVIPVGATLKMGRTFDPEAGFISSSTLYLDRTITVEGAVSHQSATVYVGDREYDPDLPGYVYSDGIFDVTASGVYTFASPASEMRERWSAQTGSGIRTSGTVVKQGGGASGIVLTGEPTGTFSQIDGVLEITDGSLDLTADLVAAGFSELRIAGGTVRVDEDVVLDALVIKSGRLEGTGQISVDDLLIEGGTIDIDGTLIVPEAGTARLGLPPDPDQTFQPNATLVGELLVEGTLTHGRAYLSLGGREYDSDAGVYVSSAGIITLADTGTLNLASPRADMALAFGADPTSGIGGSGQLVKSGGGTSEIPLREDFTGDIEVTEGQLRFSSGVTTITAATVAAGLTHVELTGGTLVIAEDITLESLTISGGVLTGPGTATIAGRMDWTGGSMQGTGGLVIASTAEVQFGFPIEESTSQRSLPLSRAMTIEGAATFGNANLALGRYFNDGGTNVGEPGGLTIAAGGTLDFRNTTGGIRINDTRAYDGNDAPVGLVNDGTVSRSYGSAETYLAVASSTGAFGTSSGGFYMNTGVFVSDADTDTGIFDHLRLAAGVLEAAGNFTTDRLHLDGTRLEGSGDVTVTEELTWSRGEMAGTGTTTVAASATALLGLTTNPLSPTTQNQLQLTRMIEIAGEARLEAANLRLGDYFFDSALGSFVNTPGTVEIDGGTLRLVGDRADVSARWTSSGGANDNGILNQGVLIKSGGGTSTFGSGAQLSGSGVYQTEDGAIEIGSGTTLVVTAGMELSRIILNGGTIDVASNGSVVDLTILNGTLTGSGDLTVTESLVFRDGEMQGSGRTIIAAGAEALFGALDDGDGDPLRYTPIVGRETVVEGTAKLEQVQVYLGSNLNESAELRIASGGVLELSGANSDFRDWRSDGTTSNAITVEGTLQKTGGGTADIPAGIALSITGSVETPGGAITHGATTYGSYTPPATMPVHATEVGSGTTLELTAADGISELTVNNGTLVVDEDVTLTNLSMRNGRIEGTGNITVTGEFFWEGGIIGTGGDITVEGSTIIGAPTNLDARVNHGNLTLGRTLNVEGTGLLEQAQLYLGENVGGTASNGVVNVASGATFNLNGWRADIRQIYGDDSRLVVDGTLVKAGGGISALHSSLPVTGSGAIVLEDGVLELQSGATLTVTSALDLSGIAIIAINGGVLEITDDVTIRGIWLQNGTIQGDGDITITESLVAERGLITGPGDLMLAAGSESVFGFGIDPANATNRSTLTLGRETTVDGDLVVARGNVPLGHRIYDATLGDYVVSTGNVTISDTGSLEMWGEYSDFSESFAEEGESAFVSVAGQLTKTGGGYSSLPNLTLGATATVVLENGALALTEGEFALTQEIVNAGFDRIVVDGASLVVSEDVTLAQLELRNGSVGGAGDLTITELLDWNGASFGNASFGGAGSLRVLDGATAIFSDSSGRLGRDTVIEGDLTLTQRLYLGSTSFDPGTSTTVYSNGLLTIADTGSLTFDGINADIRLWTTPPEGKDWGVSNAGHIVLDPISDSELPLLGAQTGTFDLAGGDLTVSSGGSLVLTDALVASGINNVRLNGGTLIVDTDVTLPSLTIDSAGLVEGSGSLQITDSFDWISGTVGPTGGVTVATGAEAQFGNPHDPDGFSFTTSLSLRTDLALEGSGNLGDGRLELGTRVYNPDIQDFEVVSGAMTIAPGATLTMNGPRADMRVGWQQDETSGVINDGEIVKIGGGNSSLPLIGGTGTFDFVNGALILDDARITLTQELIDAGFSQIVLEGSTTVTVGEALTIDSIEIRGGTLISDHDLTITGELLWTSGEINVTDSTLTIAESATARVGELFDAENPFNTSFVSFFGDMDVAGDLTLNNARVTVGQERYDPATASYNLVKGTIDVLVDGSMEFAGPQSGLFDNRYFYQEDDVYTPAGVSNAGTLVKSGGGLSELLLYGDNDSGIFDVQSGRFELSTNSDRFFFDSAVSPQDATLLLTPQMVANGLDEIVVGEGYVVVNEDVVLQSLELRQFSSVLDGFGDVEVAGRFDFSGGVVLGTGDLVLAETGTALIGEPTDLDNTGIQTNPIYIGRTLVLDGSARIEQARVTLGDTAYFEDAGWSIFDGAEFRFLTSVAADGPLPGVIDVSATGELEFYGPISDLAAGNEPEDDDTSGVVSTGRLVKLGGGTTSIEEQLRFENDGEFQFISGQFDAPGTANDFGF